MKWYYLDKDNNKVNYFGNVIEKNNKYYGTLVETKRFTERKEVFPVKDKTEIESVEKYFVWKDFLGNEHIYDPSIDGKILYDDEGKPYINKMLETKLNLIWHKGE